MFLLEDIHEAFEKSHINVNPIALRKAKLHTILSFLSAMGLMLDTEVASRFPVCLYYVVVT